MCRLYLAQNTNWGHLIFFLCLQHRKRKSNLFEIARTWYYQTVQLNTTALEKFEGEAKQNEIRKGTFHGDS